MSTWQIAKLKIDTRFKVVNECSDLELLSLQLIFVPISMSSSYLSTELSCIFEFIKVCSKQTKTGTKKPNEWRIMWRKKRTKFLEKCNQKFTSQHRVHWTLDLEVFVCFLADSCLHCCFCSIFPKFHIQHDTWFCTLPMHFTHNTCHKETKL